MIFPRAPGRNTRPIKLLRPYPGPRPTRSGDIGAVRVGEAAPVATDPPLPDPVLLDVVVVDDEAPSRDLLMARLRAAGYRPRAFATAFAALLELSERVPDILISDVNMPGMDGLALARQVRANGWTPRPYVIITSASGERDVPGAALAAGADAFVPKSASIAGFEADFGERLRRSLGRRPGPGAPPVSSWSEPVTGSCRPKGS